MLDETENRLADYLVCFHVMGDTSSTSWVTFFHVMGPHLFEWYVMAFKFTIQNVNEHSNSTAVNEQRA